MFNILKAIRGLQNVINLLYLPKYPLWNEGARIHTYIKSRLNTYFLKHIMQSSPCTLPFRCPTSFVTKSDSNYANPV